MIRRIASIVEEGDRFLIVTHVNPDGDAIGSWLGMHLALAETGKRSWALSRDKTPELYEFLPGYKLVVTDPDQVTEQPDWIISLDAATEDRISGDISRFRNGAKLINIDHHPTNPRFGDINLVEPHATSTAELVFRILKEVGHPLSPDVAKCLYTGLVTDTGCFRFAGVNSETLTIAAEILKTGFDSYEVTRHLYEEYPLRRLYLERLMLERTEIFLDGALVVSTLYADDFEKLGAETSETENLVDRLRDSRGVFVGVLMTQLSDELVRVSLRSKDEVNVSDIARTFGGGGHRRAAGLRSHLPLPELKRKIVDAVEIAIRDREAQSTL